MFSPGLLWRITKDFVGGGGYCGELGFASGYVVVENPTTEFSGLVTWTAKSQTLLCRLRFSIRVELRRIY